MPVARIVSILKSVLIVSVTMIAALISAVSVSTDARADWARHAAGTYYFPSVAEACDDLAAQYPPNEIIILRQSGLDQFYCRVNSGTIFVAEGYIEPRCLGGGFPSLFFESGCATSLPEVKACGEGCPDHGPVSDGNPISVGTGNKFQRIVDFQTAGPHRLGFVRYYNSRAVVRASHLGMGFGWSHSYNRGVLYSGANFNSATSVRIARPDGSEVNFSLQGGVWTPDADAVERLTKDATARTWAFTNAKDEVETFNEWGSLLSIRARDGYQIDTQWTDLPGSGWQITGVTDSHGRSLQFSYSDTRLVGVTAPDGGVYQYSYDSGFAGAPGNSRLVRVERGGAGGAMEVETYLYEDVRYPFALTGIVDENGDRHVTWAYDSELRATLSEQAGGADRTEFVYHADGSRTVTGPLGDQTIYRFTNLLGLPRVTSEERQATVNVPAATRTSTYDANAFFDTRTDWSGTVTDYDYDGRGLEVQRIEAVGTPQQRTITTTWHPTHRVPTQIVAPNVTTDMTYDSSGRLLTRTETDTTTHTVPYATNGRTRTWTYTYNAAGLVETVDGPRAGASDVTTYAYTASGYLERVTNALGQITEVTAHNGRGLPTSMTDVNGVVTDMTYDGRGRLLTRIVRDPGGNADLDATTVFTYDAVGQIASVRRPDGSELTYEYDAAHRVTAVSNGLGERIEYALDAMGNRTAETVKSETGAIIRSQTATFDEIGRMLQSLGAASQTTVFAYDDDSNLESTTDPLLRVTGQAFDALHRLVTVTDAVTPTAGVTTYGYDAADNLVSVTDPRGLQTVYTVDGFGFRIRTDSPDTGITDFEYDLAGNMTRRTDARSVVADYAYDALSRPTSQTYPAAPAENVTWTYDDPTPGVHGIGRLSGITDESGSTSIAYDHRGNVTQETRTIGGVAYVTGYAYDPADRLVSVTYPSGRIVSYERDLESRVAAVFTRASIVSADFVIAWNMAYRPFGPLESFSFGNGLDVTLGYDLDGRLTDIDTGPAGAAPTVQDLAYVYDDANNILSIADALDLTRDQGFGYDQLNRLTSATGLYGTLGYDYDSVGNRTLRTIDDGLTVTSEAYTPDVFSNRLDQMVIGSTPTRALTHSASGQITADDRDGVVYGYGYDNSDRMNSVTVGGVTTADYVHNALGQRVVKDVGGVVTHFHYDRAGRLIAETAPDGLGGFTMVKEYVDIDGLPLAVIEPGTGTGSAAEVIVDNVDQQASGTGVWDTDVSPSGYQGADYALRRGGTGTETFSWTPNVATAGRYQVFARWPELDAAEGSNVTYTVNHAGGATPVTVDQRADGGQWALLGNFPFVPASGHNISLSDHAEPAVPNEITVDNRDPNTARTGSGWWSDTWGPLHTYGPDFTGTNPGTGNRTFTWSPEIPASGRYKVYARWVATHTHATAAPFTIHHSGGSTTVTADLRYNSGAWNYLGTFDFAPASDHRIVLSDNNAGGYLVADAVRLIRSPTASGADEVVVDNTDPGAVRTGSGWWTDTWGTHITHGPNFTSTTPGNGSRYLTWTPALPATDFYNVYTRWNAGDTHAASARYTIHHSGGATTVIADQRVNGAKWNLLGRFAMAPGSNHRVVLSNLNAGGYPVADAVKFVRDPVGDAAEILVDDSDPSVTVTGTWDTLTAWNHMHGGGYRSHAAGTGSDSIDWAPALPQAGSYAVYVWYWDGADRATNAEYTVRHASGTTTMRVDQRLNGRVWNLLGTFEMTPGAGHGVSLSDDADGVVIADAMRFVPTSADSQRLVAADAIRLVANTAEDPLFVHADHLGTPRKMTDATQTIVWDHVTRPFGETHLLLGLPENNHRFLGQYFDAETTLHYNYFRDYDPALGRYVQSDPIGLRGGLNTFSYAFLNPLVFYDSLGLASFASVEGHAGIGAGYAVVQCCDEAGDLNFFYFNKWCGGFTFGVSLIAGSVINLDGEDCDPSNYSGYFVEIGGGAGLLAGGVDIGFSSDGWIPTGPSNVNEAGFGIGLGAPIGVSVCWYSYMGENKVACGCKVGGSPTS